MGQLHRYIIFGPQGSGKGTQAELLAESLAIPHIASGDLFRDEVAHGTELGKRIAADIETGKLMPDEDANTLIKSKIERHEEKAYVLDGYPRTKTQAEFLDSIAAPTHVVLLELDDEESVRRIGGRRVCPTCKHVYHLIYHPSKVIDVCDECGGALVIRGDDKEQAIRERLRLYHEVTEPVASYYEAQNKLSRVSAVGSIFEVKMVLDRALHLEHIERMVSL